MLRYERQTVAMVLAVALHDSCGVGPDEQVNSQKLVNF